MLNLEWFKTGIRVIMLKTRPKDGVEKYSDRKAIKHLSKNPEDFDKTISLFQEIKAANPEIPYRIYVSVNSRNLLKAIKDFKLRMVEADYSSDEHLNGFYLDIKNRFFSSCQKVCSRESKYFMIDLDYGEDMETVQDYHDIVADLIAKDIRIEFVKDSPNGKHLITQPFDRRLTKLEVKTDALLYWG